MQMGSMETSRTLQSCFLPGGIEIKRDDCVLIRPSELGEEPFIARVRAVLSDNDGISNVRVRVRYYYRPEETKDGIRERWQGADEVFLSGHFDVLSVATIESKCSVHTLEEFLKLKLVANEDFFHRADYNASEGTIDLSNVEVHCVCKVLYNPDDLVVECEGCDGRFHPACMGMTNEEAIEVDHFFCGDCSSRQ